MGTQTTTRRRVTRRRALPVLALPLTMALLAACSGGAADADDAPAPGAEAPAPAEPVDLRMTVWSANEDHLALFDEIAAEYVEANPDLVSSITFEPLPFDEYTTAVTTQVAGGNPPDLAWILESTAPEFVESGALVALDDVLAGTEGYAVEDLNPDALSLWQSEDQLYAYPFSTSPFVVFVNDDMLAAAGQPTGRELLDSGEWTWDRIQEVGGAVKQATGNDGFVIRDFEYAQWEILATVWGGFGASAWSEDYTTCQLDSPEMVEAMTFLHDSAFDAAAMPAPGTTADFFAGQAAITVTQISRASLLDDSFAWDVLPMPEGPAGQQNVIGQAGIGVFANAENPDVAADFLAFFTNPENSARLGQYFPPPRVSLLTAEQLKATNPLLSEAQLEEVVVQGLEGAVTKPAHPNFAQIQQAARAELDSLWTPDADVAAVLGTTCERIQPLLEQ
ncbi:sugar ABC transporter substrate-binding protein [Actinotalea ferrariae CF5-4]|uniref:Sugar ABC transporter substrate-binding protein n=1 Tax=Actinotalea ferrariae CF5-4 TaxID=948458 RepID=A0A021VS61_9CELL|nr:sugar ABC transporter substrate-binding protein [Actinotalea ferrariae]EYR63968.1 sugar ABC transporter substrate-binding protein [Actinotalea ferrariae CF5-4]